MKTKSTPKTRAPKPEPRNEDAIAHYARAQSPKHAAICRTLRTAIDTALPAATSRIWHAIPVWFVGENPVVGCDARAKNVTLLFWNGQSFDEPVLQPAGSFKAAQIQYTDASEIDVKSLSRWLKKAGANIWDYQGLRRKK